MQFKYITVALAAVATNVFAAPVQNEAEAVEIVPRANNAVNSAHYANAVNQINQHLTKAGIQIKNVNNRVQYCIPNYFNNCYDNYRALLFNGCNVDYFGNCGGNTIIPWNYLINTYPSFLDYGYVNGCNALANWVGCGNDYYPLLYKKDVSSADVQQQEE